MKLDTNLVISVSLKKCNSVVGRCAVIGSSKMAGFSIGTEVLAGTWYNGLINYNKIFLYIYIMYLVYY